MDTNTSMDCKISRRRFLKYTGILGMGFAFSGLMPASESVKFNRKLYKVTGSRLAMGTFVAVTLLHSSRDKAEEVIETAFEEMDQTRCLFDRYQSCSPIGNLNLQGYSSGLPPEVIQVISRAIHFNMISHGAFDITVQPLVDLYKDHFAAWQTPPPEIRILQALELVDSKAIKYDTDTLWFAKEGMGITLDGIAQGHVIDHGIRVLQRNGIKHGLINAGGDVRIFGGRDGKRAWHVAVQNPSKKGHYVDIIRMDNGAVATSGNYEIYFDNEKLYHHIINPKNGRSPNYNTSVTVLAENAMDADALSTAVFAMEPEAGKAFIEKLPGIECLILSSSNNKIASSTWPAV